MRKFHKKGLIALVAGVIVVVGAGGAYAYWTQGGTGSATGNTGTTGTITLAGTAASGVFPGGTRSVSLTAANSAASAVTVGTVHLDSVTTSVSGCVVADFTMGDVVENFSVPGGNVVTSLPNNGTLSMANTALNQDLCKSVTVTLTLSST
jgi:hypothetical protein